MAKTITAYPATKNTFTAAPLAAKEKRRVAGYARVSTDTEEQNTSYEAQVDYYTRYIQEHAGWEFVRVYTDDGISGTNTKHRDGFNTMVEDALSGKIDLIVTKSVSRFARNTVDSLTTIRELKAHGVECYFEKENIWTFDGKGELLLTIMSSLAQEESRSISENTTWGCRKRMEDGKVSLAYSNFLGYDRGQDGELVINEKEAKTVRLIYRSFMDGMTPVGIAHMLEKKGIPSPMGKKKWHGSTVLSILQNEKYKGDAMLQKTFTVDFLTKKHKKNSGEVPWYYIEGNHKAIIAPAEFEQVQEEIQRRKAIGQGYSGGGTFASRIVCGDCGGFYGQKVWHSNDKYRKVVWRCNQKYEKKKGCGTPTLTEEQLRRLFLKAYSHLMEDREAIAGDCRIMADMLSDTSALDAKIAAAEKEMREIVTLNGALLRSQTEDFADKIAEYNERYRKAEVRLEKLQAERSDRITRSKAINMFIEELMRRDCVLEQWDEQLWNLLLEKAFVRADGSVEFVFKGERTVTVNNA